MPTESTETPFDSKAAAGMKDNAKIAEEGLLDSKPAIRMVISIETKSFL